MRTVRFDEPCDECLLTCRKIKNKGGIQARFLVVGKPTTDAMVRNKNNLTPAAMRLLGKHMKDAGFGKGDFVFTNAIKCGYDATRWRSKDRHIIEHHCREHLLRLIEKMKPDVIIPLGAEAAKAVAGRSVKISKVRGVPEYNREHETWVLPIMDPTHVHLNPQHEPIFASDCKSLGRFVDHDYDLEAAEQDVLGKYELITDLQFLIDEEPELLAFDTETKGMRWQESSCKLLTMQFCTEPGRAYLLSWDHPDAPASMRQKAKIIRQLKQLLQNPKTSVFGQNLKYDALWILDRLGFRFRIDHDTLMLAAIVDENSMTKDLDTLTKIYAPEMAGYADTFNSKYDKSRMDLVPLTEILGYGCGDVDACFRVFEELGHEVYQDEKLWAYYRRVAIPGINAFVPIEHTGMNVDELALDEFEDVLAEYVEDIRVRLMAQVPRSIKQIHAEAGLKFSRKAFLLDILFNHADGYRLTPRTYTKATQNLDPEFQIPSTSSKDHLPFFFDHAHAGEFCTDLAEWMKMDRLLGTNVRRFRENYIVNGKIHPIYSLWTAVTGRTASRDPNGQNFPKRGKQAKAYRKIFIPPPGFVVLEADLSQAELRISADMSNDRTMLSIYGSGGDIHKATATIVMGVTMKEFDALPKEEQSLARFKAKAVNFGFLYGMGWRKFIIYAKTQYGVEFTEQEARRIRSGFFSKYCSLPLWHDATRDFAMDYGYVRSYSGRIRHLPMVHSEDTGIQAEAVRQAINSPVQNFGSDLGVMSIARLVAEVNPEYMQVMGFVHDAIYAYVPEDCLEWGAKTLKHYMETNPLEEWFGRKMKVPIVADVGFGWNGGETYEMAGLTLDDEYDFDELAWDEEEEEYMFDLPEQVIPPDNGRLPIPEYMVIEA